MPSPVEYRAIRDALLKYDYRPLQDSDTEVAELADCFASIFQSKEAKCAVLGIDVVEYGKMIGRAQQMVPALLRLIRDEALSVCQTSEPMIFSSPDGMSPFVSTGDGGFQAFANPLQALVFAVYYQWFLAAYNSFHFLPRTGRLLQQELVVRFAITFADMFVQDANIFGDAVIANARIMSKDTLNRCLLDANSVRWFRERFVSIESLLTVGTSDLASALGSPSTSKSSRSRLFGGSSSGAGIRAAHLQKIGAVKAKERELSIFSLMIQVAVPRGRGVTPSKGSAVVSIGNLNPSGITT